jgi:hypothetical protein
MAYTNGAGLAATLAAIQTANANAATDAVTNALSGLATGAPTAIGTPVLMWGVLVKCTTGWGSVPGGTIPVYSYDASPA